MMPSHILDDALNNVIIRVNKSWKVVQKKNALRLVNISYFILKRTTLLGLCVLAYSFLNFTSK
jgi:hypothetical protein